MIVLVREVGRNVRAFAGVRSQPRQCRLARRRLIGASRLDLHDQGLIPGQVYRLIGNNDPSVIMCIESDHGLPPCSMFQYLMPDPGTAAVPRTAPGRRAREWA